MLTPTGLLSHGRFRRPRRAWRSRTSVGQLRFTHAGPRQFSTFHEFHNICYATFACVSYIEMRHSSNLGMRQSPDFHSSDGSPRRSWKGRLAASAWWQTRHPGAVIPLVSLSQNRWIVSKPSRRFAIARRTTCLVFPMAARATVTSSADASPAEGQISCASCLPARIVSRAVQH